MIFRQSNFFMPNAGGAQMTYAYALQDDADVERQKTERNSGSPTRVELVLSFERVDAVWAPASDRVAMDDPYFLTRIDATGIESPDCWSPTPGDSASSAVTPCDECKQNGRDFFLCRDVVDKIEDCYAK